MSLLFNRVSNGEEEAALALIQQMYILSTANINRKNPEGILPSEEAKDKFSANDIKSRNNIVKLAKVWSGKSDIAKSFLMSSLAEAAATDMNIEGRTRDDCYLEASKLSDELLIKEPLDAKIRDSAIKAQVMTYEVVRDLTSPYIN